MALMAQGAIHIKTPAEIDGMRAAGQSVAALLDYLSALIAPGVSSAQIDELAAAWMKERGLRAAPLGYAPRGHTPFPKSLCASVNHQVCHGIPNDKPLRAGDLLKIDATVIQEGWHGDSCRSFLVGSGKPAPIAATRLMDLAHQAMWEGIYAAQSGAPLNAIGLAIEAFVRRHSLGTVRDFCGHGLGLGFHEAPTVRHYFDPRDTLALAPGMTLTVEPMITLGASGAVRVLPDGWTAVTKDHTLCSQWEHSVLIREEGPEVLTVSSGMPPPPERFASLDPRNPSFIR